MPIEIRELVIKMTVDSQRKQDSHKMKTLKSDKDIEEFKEDIIRECTARIIGRMNNNKER